MAEIEMSNNTLAVVINMVLLIAYTLYIRLNDPNADSIFTLVVFIALHFIACFVLALALKDYRKGLFLASALVLLVGFSTCYLAYSIH